MGGWEDGRVGDRIKGVRDLEVYKLAFDCAMKILKIDAHYIKARYKEDRFNEKIYNKRNAASLLKDTEDVIRWYTKKLKLEI